MVKSPTIQNLSKAKLKAEVKKELEKCLILDQKDKDFWLQNLDNLPLYTLVNVLEILRTKNAIVDRYMDIALEKGENQHYVKLLKMEIKKIQNEAFAIEDKFQSGEAEKDLETQLNNL